MARVRYTAWLKDTGAYCGCGCCFPSVIYVAAPRLSHIVERVDSIETTLAHLLPEMTANIAGALAVLVLLFLEDWRTGLSMLIVVPPGALCFASMFSGYNEQFQRTVTATKALNDTAVEYISGIAGTKAFGQSKASYEKFLNGLR